MWWVRGATGSLEPFSAGYRQCGVSQLGDVRQGWLTGQKYMEILTAVLCPSVRNLSFPEPERASHFYLVHDKNPIHTSREVQAWFRQHQEITVMPHLPQSCELNPTELAWAAMVSHMPTSERYRSRAGVTTGDLEPWKSCKVSPDETWYLRWWHLFRRLNEVMAPMGGWVTPDIYKCWNKILLCIASLDKDKGYLELKYYINMITTCQKYNKARNIYNIQRSVCHKLTIHLVMWFHMAVFYYLDQWLIVWYQQLRDGAD